MARRKRGGSGPRSRGTNRKRAGSGKGPQNSFSKGVTGGILGTIGAAVVGKLFNRDEKEVEEILTEGGGRFGKAEVESLMNGGTGKGMTQDVTRHPEGPNAHGGEPEYQNVPEMHPEEHVRRYGTYPDTSSGTTDEDSPKQELKQEIDATLKSLEEKLAAAKKEAADVGKPPASGGTPDEARTQIDEAYGGTPADAEAQIKRAYAGRGGAAPPTPPTGTPAHQFGSAPPRGGLFDPYLDSLDKRMPPGQGVRASEDPLARGIGEGRYEQPAGPFAPYLDRTSGGSSGGARMGPGQGVMAPQGAPLSALTPDRPQTGQGQTEKERFIARAMAGGAERPQTLPLPVHPALQDGDPATTAGRMPAGQGVMAPEAAREAMHRGGTPGGIAGEQPGEPLGVEPGLRGGETATVSGLTPRDRPAPSRPSLSIEDTMGRREGSRRDRRRSRAEESVGDPALDFGDLDPLERTHTPEKTRGGKKKAAGRGGLTHGFVAVPKTKKSGETTKEYNSRRREAHDKNEARKAEILRDDSLSDEEAAAQWLSEGLTGTINAKYNGRRVTVKDGKIIRGAEFAAGIRKDALYFVDVEEEMGAGSWFD